MLLGETIRVALGALRANALRSLLTMLGIVIGVAAVIAMVALGNGAEGAVKDRIARLGTTVLQINPQRVTQGGIGTTSIAKLTMPDVEALRLRKHPPAEFKVGMNAAFDVLGKSRPTAVNLFWALARMRLVWETGDGTPERCATRLIEAAHEIFAADVAANRRMGSYGAELIKDGATVLTHCNAGALATAGHGTALGVIRSAVEAGKKISVFAD